jgi:hypothetical protein
LLRRHSLRGDKPEAHEIAEGFADTALLHGKAGSKLAVREVAPGRYGWKYLKLRRPQPFEALVREEAPETGRSLRLH